MNLKFGKDEGERLRLLTVYEQEAYSNGAKYIAGIDEAGRGPLAGPVVAAAVILPRGCVIEGVDDSKKLSAKKREYLFEIIKEKSLSWATGIVDEKIIDEINILNATREAMRTAVWGLDVVPDYLLVDAENIPGVKAKCTPIIKGDTLSISIAAASIIAKVTRDRIMEQYDKIYPEYGFSKHKGYGTAEHMAIIREKGLCPIHRRSFTKKLV